MIQIQNVSKTYGEHVIFDQLNLSIPKDRITCILGESGVGKTTLLNMISGITSYYGKITAPEKIAYIFQESRLIPNLTVLENLKFVVPNVTEEELNSVLTLLEIEDKKQMFPNQLSGGEQQRVSIARAFLYDAPVILMDEPFSSLDLSLKYRLICHFAALWNEKKKTVVFVTHTIDEAVLLAHDILVLHEGKIKIQYTLDMPLPRELTANEEIRKQIIKDLVENPV